MPAPASELLRARTDDDRHARTRSIIRAAENLFAARAGRLPTMSEVARESGIAKGTVYLYFPTKETLFLQLFGARAEEWIASLEQRIEASKGSSADIEEISDAILAYPLANPRVLDLASYSSTLLEANIPLEVTLAFKVQLGERLNEAGRVFAAKLDDVNADEAAMLLIRSYAYLIGIWQLVELPVGLREARRRSRIKLFSLNFEEHARDGLARLWRTAGQER